ncbi:MAG: SprT-like domain-containing protein [Candidatus Zixiibacteriota bacterium]
MAKTVRQQKALARLNYDLFQHPGMVPPAPATLYTVIKQHAERLPEAVREPVNPAITSLPTEDELSRWFDEFNWLYFAGKLPRVRIEYSARMTSAGSYTPNERLIRISRKYHQVFPDEIHDTLKHEMIHILHEHHDASFKREAARIGASIRAKSHPSLRRPPRYLYVCPACGYEYPRQKRLRMASCGRCSKGGYDERYKLRAVRSKA